MLSHSARENNSNPTFILSLDSFYTNGTLKTYSQVRKRFSAEPGAEWTGYILGAFYVLLKEGKIDQFPHGATIVIKSDIPIGGGVASSAAIEVATLMAIDRLYGLELNAMEVARLAQIVENRIVGGPLWDYGSGDCRRWHLNKDSLYSFVNRTKFSNSSPVH